jgi:uncharacterized membrane protein
MRGASEMEDGMDPLRESLKTLVRGVFFLVPIALLVILLVQAVKLLAGLLRPVAKLVPAETVGGAAMVDVVAAAVIVALCFAAGLLARTAIGRAVGDRLEHVVLQRIPGFTLVKSMTHGMVGIESGSEVKVVLAWIEESWVLAFMMERHGNGLSTVFVPSAPTPAAGAIYYLPDDRLRMLDVPVSAAVACVTRLGLGSRLLLANASLAAPEASASPG